MRHGTHSINIDLRIAREDILMGLNKLLLAEQTDLNQLVESAFNKIDLEAIITKQIYKEVDRQVAEEVTKLVVYGEGKEIIDKYISNLIDNKISSHLEYSIKKAVEASIGKGKNNYGI
jgi:hypothetical protein